MIETLQRYIAFEHAVIIFLLLTNVVSIAAAALAISFHRGDTQRLHERTRHLARRFGP